MIKLFQQQTAFNKSNNIKLPILLVICLLMLPIDSNAQKKKIKSVKDVEDIVNKALKSNQKTILIVIYNNQNQRRYIGVKLD